MFKIVKAANVLQNKSDVKVWLEEQDAYTRHRPVRKRFLSIPYTLTNLMYVWECDLLDLQIHSIANRCFLEISVSGARKDKHRPCSHFRFRSLFHDSLLPVWVRKEKGEEFLKQHFQVMLRDVGIQFQVCRNPCLKCEVVERAHRTIRDRLFKFFIFSNSYRYIDLLPEFVKAYNDTVHTTTGLVPLRVTDANFLAIWHRMEASWQRVRFATAKFRVGQHVRISNEKMKFAKAAEHNFSTEIFRIVKVIHRRPRVVWELVDVNDTPIDRQFYSGN